MTTIIVVLGIQPDSTKIPSELEGRVDLAIKIHQRLENSKMLFTGGYTNKDIDLSESDIMKRYALSRDIPPDSILTEDRSENTIENAYYSMLIREQWNSDTVYVVTSCYHLERCKFVFEKIFPTSTNLHFECYESNRPDDEIYESEALSSTRNFFEDIDEGDIGEIADKIEGDSS